MQQYGKKTKRRRQIELTLSYIFMSLAVVVISTIAVMLAMGYQFNFEKKQIEQGALLQIASTPSGSTISLDETKLSFTTPGKQSINVGSHSIKIHKDGYRDWSKQFTVRAGEVRWLNYARLVPSTVETKAVKQVAGVASEAPSPNHRYMALIADAAVPEVTIIDVRDADKIVTSTIKIPDTQLSLPENSTHSFVIEEWNLASKYLLVRHNFTGGQEFIRLTVDDEKDVINLSKKFGVNLQTVHFSDGASFYGLENGNIRRFDVGAGSLSEPIAQNVVQMKLHGSKNLVFVRHLAAKYQVAVRINDHEQVVASYDDTLPVLVDIGEYFNDFYVGIAQGASFELVKSPEKNTEQQSSVVTMTLPNHPKWLDISSNGRFVIFGDEMQFINYDIELKTKTPVDFAGSLEQTTYPQWIDDYILAGVSGGKLGIRDFDGDNYQIITDALPGHRVMLSSDGSLLYSFSKNSDGVFSLQASQMIIKS